MYSEETKPVPKLTIAIVTWNSSEDIVDCLRSIDTNRPTSQIVVCDNGSTDGTVELVRGFEGVRLIEAGENLGFAAACNRIAAETTSELILFLNPDSIVPLGTLAEATSWLEDNPDAGLVSVKMLDENGTTQKTCYRFPSLTQSVLDSLGLFRLVPGRFRKDILLGEFFDCEETREIDWAYGAFMMVRRKAFEAAGGMPEDYFLFAEDTDVCYQLRKAGWKVWHFAGAQIIHKGNRSAGQLPSKWRVERTVASKYVFCHKNYGLLRTKLIEIADLAGNLLERLTLFVNRSPVELIGANRLYRRVILDCILSRESQLLAGLAIRPEFQPCTRTAD